MVRMSYAPLSSAPLIIIIILLLLLLLLNFKLACFRLFFFYLLHFSEKNRFLLRREFCCLLATRQLCSLCWGPQWLTTILVRKVLTKTWKLEYVSFSKKYGRHISYKYTRQSWANNNCSSDNSCRQVTTIILEHANTIGCSHNALRVSLTLILFIELYSDIY